MPVATRDRPRFRLAAFDPAVADNEPSRISNTCEKAWFGAGHPNLTCCHNQSVEQGGAARWIEVRGDLVKQEKRAAAAMLGDEIGVGKNKAEQERLLLAR